MSSDMRWRINIKNMETRIGIGIHSDEQQQQRALLNAVIEADYPARPASIEDCFNYDHVYHLVVQEWPKRPHRYLLETCITDPLQHIFTADDRVVYAKVS